MINFLLKYLFIALLLTNCSLIKAKDEGILSEEISTDTTESDTEYTLQKGDRLDIKFFYNPEINETEAIRPDGRISLQLIDDVIAEGLTPSQLKKLLMEKYSSIIKQPDVTIIVKEFAGYKVYVGGEVHMPSLIPFSGNLTALQAIFQANGFKNSAELENVVILRNQGTSTPKFITVNIKNVLSEQKNDLNLKPYDIVFVPKTIIAKMDQFVEEYFDKLIPISRAIGFSYNLNPTVKVEQK